MIILYLCIHSVASLIVWIRVHSWFKLIYRTAVPSLHADPPQGYQIPPQSPQNPASYKSQSPKSARCTTALRPLPTAHAPDRPTPTAPHSLFPAQDHPSPSPESASHASPQSPGTLPYTRMQSPSVPPPQMPQSARFPYHHPPEIHTPLPLHPVARSVDVKQASHPKQSTVFQLQHST